MTKQEIINKLLDINFVCVDAPDETDVKGFCNYERRKSFLVRKTFESKYFVSFRTKNAVDNYNETMGFDEFHEISHLIMLDRIIGAISCNRPLNVSMVEQALHCGVIEESVVNWVKNYMADENSIKLVA